MLADREQPLGRRGGRRVLRARGQQCADQHLKRIFLARFGDLLDGRKLEAVDLARERAHHRSDVLAAVTRAFCESRGARAGSMTDDWQ